MALGLKAYLSVVLLMEIIFLFVICESTIYWRLETRDSGERKAV